MTEETAPEAKTWDLKAALIGRTFSKDVIPVFLDEEAMLKFNRVALAADKMDKSAEVERDAMVLEYADQVVWVTVQEVPRYVKENLDIQMLKDHPTDNLDTAGIIDRNKEFQARFWQMHVVSYKGPDGVEKVPDREDIDTLIAYLPEASFKAVERAIREMQEDSEHGYENMVLEMGFLSQP